MSHLFHQAAFVVSHVWSQLVVGDENRIPL